jgi:hypothetical protein
VHFCIDISNFGCILGSTHRMATDTLIFCESLDFNEGKWNCLVLELSLEVVSRCMVVLEKGISRDGCYYLESMAVFARKVG